MLNTRQKELVDKLFNSIEPNKLVRNDDLKHLARYFVKIGTDVTIVCKRQQRKRLLKHSELNADLIEKLVRKYNLSWSKDCDRLEFEPNTNRTLHHVAHCYPEVFLEIAAHLSPGGYEERRFWWCANNQDFYRKHSPFNYKNNRLQLLQFSTSRIVSEVLFHFLTFDEPKLIALCALHMSVKHSDSQVFLVWYQRNVNWLSHQIKLDFLAKTRPEVKRQGRALFRIAEAEAELNTVHVDYFIDWWNLTGLRRVNKPDFEQI